MMNANGSRIAISSQKYAPAGAAGAVAAAGVAHARAASVGSNRDDSRAWRWVGIIMGLRVASAGGDRIASGAYPSRRGGCDKRHARAASGPDT